MIGRALAGEELPREPQGEGRYVSRAGAGASCAGWSPGDDVDRKLRAFWYPPWPGATMAVDGRELTLVDETLLGEVAQAYRQSGRIP